MEFFTKMVRNADLVVEKPFYQMNMNCIAFGCKVIKRNYQLSKNSRKKINYISTLHCAEIKKFCICRDVYRIYESADKDKLFDVLIKLKNKNVKFNNIFIEKHNVMNENPNFEQKYYSRTAKSINKTGHDSIKFITCLAYYDRTYYKKKQIFIV